jgi:hypothetical protein
MKKLLVMAVLGMALLAGTARAGDPMLSKVGGVYMGEKAAQLLQNYFNAVSPYVKAKASPYENTAPLSAFILFDSKAQVIRVTLVGSSGDQARSTIETARDFLLGSQTKLVQPLYSASKLVRDNCGIELNGNNLIFEFYDAVHDNISK